MPFLFSRTITKAYWVVATFVATMGGILVPLARAQADFTFKFEPRAIGSASVYGYALWTTQLGSVQLNGYTVPLRADFNTDPRPAPTASPLGAGWSIPLVSSALVEQGQDGLRWHRPDGRIFTFMRERGLTGQETKSSAQKYIAMDSTWTAVKESKSRYYTLTHTATGAELIYEDGLLVRFSFVRPSEGGERYAMTYNRLRRPVRISVVNSAKILAEFIYENAMRAKELQLGGTGESSSNTIFFEYENTSLNQFREGPYLTKIKSGDTHSALESQTIAITYQSNSRDTNRVSIECGKDNEKTTLVWAARSGFLSKDDGATYKVENPSLADQGRPVSKVKLDENGKSGKSDAIVVDYNWYPDDAKITRTEGDGKSEFRYYDRAKGVYTQTNKDGISLVTYYLLSPGPMNGKVRKMEEVRGKDVRMVERNAYDEKGRLVRKMDELNNTEIFQYDDVGKSIRFFRNGTLVFVEYFTNERLLKRVEYTQAGIKEDQYDELSGQLISRTLNGDIIIENPYIASFRQRVGPLSGDLAKSQFIPDPKNPKLMIRAR